MKKSFIAIILSLTFWSSNSAFAWVQTGNTTIKELVQWESTGAGFALLKLDSGHNCFVPLAEKELYSLALALYMSGRTFNLHCHDESKNINGYIAHKIHRVNAVK